MQLIQERRVNGHRISEHVVFFGATNDTSHRAGVSGILETVKSRFDIIVELVPDVDDWCSWACGPGNMPPELVGFIRFRPDLLNDFKPTRELTNSPSPRAVAAVGEWVNDGITDLPTLAGAAGAGFASEFIGLLKLYRSLPSILRLAAQAVALGARRQPAHLLHEWAGHQIQRGPRRVAEDGRVAVGCIYLSDGRSTFPRVKPDYLLLWWWRDEHSPNPPHFPSGS